jgi:hypothetical protein
VLLDAQPNLAAVLAAFGGVGKEIDDNLFQPGCIGVQSDGLRRQRDRKLLPALVDQMGVAATARSTTLLMATSRRSTWTLPTLTRETSIMSSTRRVS